MSGPRDNPGFTLIELVVVVAIMVVLAGIVVPLVSGIREDSASVATTTSLQAVRAAIVGSPPNQPGYLCDVGQMPTTVRDLFVMPPGVLPFDPLTRRGWRSPYLQGNTGTYRVDAGRGFTTGYGADGDPAMVDAWGQSIVIQAPTNAPDSKTRDQFTRLVSAGPDGIIQTPPDQLYPTPSQRGDDVLLFLMRADTAP